MGLVLANTIKSGRALPHSKTWRSCGSARTARQSRPSARVRQCSAAFHFYRLVGVIVAMVARLMGAAVLQEDFSNDPLVHGWAIFGDTNLFHWNPTNQNLEVTWDSSKANSYFYHPFGTIGTATDSFSLSFDLVLRDVTNRNAFELSIGFFNLADATQTNFFRGTGRDSPNLVEFAYFPPFDVFLPTISQVIVSTNEMWLYNHDNLLELTAGDLFHVDMVYEGASRRLTTTTLRNGSAYGSPQIITVPANFDFRIGCISVSSYSDANADGSILAHGTVDNISVTPPPSPVQSLTGGFSNQVWRVQFLSRSNWLYTLERSADFQTWLSASPTQTGNGTNLIVQDMNPQADKAFYRVRAERP